MSIIYKEEAAKTALIKRFEIEHNTIGETQKKVRLEKQFT
mgnify:CR=1 FL=1